MGRRLLDTLLLVEPRRRRRVARLLRRMDWLDAHQVPRSAPRPRRSRSSTRAATGFVVILSLVLGALAWDAGYLGGPPDRHGTANPGPAISAGGDGAYRFLRTQPDGDAPVAYDPCTPIRLVVNPRTIVDGGSRILREAVDELQDATGLEIRVDGLVDERPGKDRPLRTSDDSAWRPVLVAWSDPRESPSLKGSVAGRGGSTSVSMDDRWWYVTGQAILDGPQLAKVLRSPDGHASVRAVVMHELAHVVGLDHVEDPGELMQPEGRPGLNSWGPGDRKGLAALGKVRCDN